jgi:hypothetical protein
MAMNQGMNFDRVEYICCQCHNTGIIRSVWLSLTRVGLEGYCLSCQIDSVAVFDLSEVDQWLRGERHDVIARPSTTMRRQDDGVTA